MDPGTLILGTCLDSNLPDFRGMSYASRRGEAASNSLR